MSFYDWFEMGGYGAFVWGAYGAAALLLGTELLLLRHRGVPARRQARPSR